MENWVFRKEHANDYQARSPLHRVHVSTLNRCERAGLELEIHLKPVVYGRDLLERPS